MSPDAPSDNRRFRIPPELSGQVHVHALLAAKQLRSFELYSQAYTELAQRMRTATGAGPPPGADDAAARMTRAMDQLAATRRDLVDLAVDSQEVGNAALRSSTFSVEPKVKPMPDPDIADTSAVAATVFVVQDRMRLEANNAADQIDKLVAVLDKIADPAVLVLAEELTRLAIGLRPPPGQPPA